MDFVPTKDPFILAELNRPVQNLHHEKYPEFFKVYDETVSIAFFKRQVERPNWSAFLVQLDGNNAGYVSYFIKEYHENPFRKSYKAIYIDQISILDEFKGHGIGKKVMLKIEEDAKNAGIDLIELSYWELNKEAKGFYEHLGYHTYTRIAGKKLV